MIKMVIAKQVFIKKQGHNIMNMVMIKKGTIKKIIVNLAFIKRQGHNIMNMVMIEKVMI